MPRISKSQRRRTASPGFCCVPQCTTSWKLSPSLSFHHFPKDENQRKVWKTNMRCPDLMVTKSMTVCSRHFVRCDVFPRARKILRRGAVPLLFHWNQYSLLASSPGVREETPPPPEATPPPPEEKSREEAMYLEQLLRGDDAMPEPSAVDGACEEVEAQQLVVLKLQKKLVEVTPPPPEATPPPSEEKSREEAMDVELLLQDDDSRPEPSAVDGACEKVEAQQLVVLKMQKKLVEATLKQKFGLERFSTSDDDIRFYTRFASYRHLQAFWKGIEPLTGEMVRVITRSSAPSQPAAPEEAAEPPRQPSPGLLLIDELFLFLMYVSLGLKEEHLANRFNIHPTAVGEIIKTWAHFLYALLGAVGIWMSPEKIRAMTPSVFGRFSDTQVLVDRVEMRCEMPSSFLSQHERFSLYKSHTTFKGMIGVSPHGAVTFVSSLFSGSVSDKELFWQSGIFPLLDKDMAVMVDKGFRIDELGPCKVYRPPFLSEDSQLSRDEVLVPEDVARLMTHVEKATRRIKEKTLFDTVIPPTFAGCINQLFVVACLLTNFQNKP